MPTLLDYIPKCASALDDFEYHDLASSTATSGTATSAVNVTTNISTARYDDRYIFVASGSNANQQRRVRPGGYDPTTGRWLIYPDWTSPGLGATVYLTGLFPVALSGTASQGTWYIGLINQALALIDREDTLSIAVTTATDYALTTWKDWIAEDRIRRTPDGGFDVREPAPISGLPAVPNPVRTWQFFADGELPKLRTVAPFSAATGTLEVSVRRPSDTWISVSGTWAESSVGLLNLADNALPPVSHVVPVFLMLAYRSLMNRQPGAPSDPTIIEKYTDAREAARLVPGYNRRAEPPPPSQLAEAA